MAYKNKEDQNAASKRHYNLHKDKYKGRNKDRKSRNKAYIQEYLRTHPCVDCGNTNPIVLDFDHVRGKKKYNVSIMSNCGYSLEVIQLEIDKCEIRCANCHRIITHKRRHT